MNKCIAVMVAAALSWGVTGVAMADTNGQIINEKKVTETVKLKSSKERMMPAPEKQLKRLTKGLKLTLEQQKQIRPMLVDEYAKLKEFRRDDTLSPKQIQAKVEALRNETVANMKNYLNPEQIEALDLVSKEIKANKQKRIRENRKSRIGSQADTPPQQPKQQ